MRILKHVEGIQEVELLVPTLSQIKDHWLLVIVLLVELNDFHELFVLS